jgi:hypothetical protein
VLKTLVLAMELVPHISRSTRPESGDSSKFKLRLKSCTEKAVLSHISRKTSEMWGTKGPFAGKEV